MDVSVERCDGSLQRSMCIFGNSRATCFMLERIENILSL
jgi:hypothetical protein